MVEDCLAEPGNSGGEGMRAVCIREVQKDLAQSAKLLIESKLSQFNLGAADGFKVFEDCTQTPGDGLIIYKGMNNYTADSIKSLEGFKRAWWEEAHTATKRSINLLRPTLRTTASQLWWSYNPNLRTDPIDIMFTGDERPTGCVVVTANWRDNPWFTAELEQERLDCLRMQPEQYDHIWDGGYITVAEGAYFARDLAKAKEEGRITDLAADPIQQVRAFWDIGVRDATSIWIAQFTGQTIKVFDYYEAVGQPLGAHLDWLRSHGYGSALCVLPHDGARTDAITALKFEDHIRQAGFQVQTVANQGKGAALKRVEEARRLFPRIWFDTKKTEGGRAALGWYHEKRDEHRNIGLGPEHDWSSHAADAFGLMCVAHAEPVTKRPQPRRHTGSGGWMA